MIWASMSWASNEVLSSCMAFAAAAGRGDLASSGRWRAEGEGIVHLGRQIVTALAKAHQSGITHRDIKPSNVLLSRDGRPMLLDGADRLYLARYWRYEQSLATALRRRAARRIVVDPVRLDALGCDRAESAEADVQGHVNSVLSLANGLRRGTPDADADDPSPGQMLPA